MPTLAALATVTPGQTITIYPGTAHAATLTVEEIQHDRASTMVTWNGVYQYIAPSTTPVQIHA